MDAEVPPERPNPDAQPINLQSHYTILQQEYDILVRESDMQHEEIDSLEKKNAQINGLLKNNIAEQELIKDAYHSVMQEHEGCQKVKEQLQDLAHRWNAQLERNKELDSTCVKLRQELKVAVKDQTLENPLPKIEDQ
jgi:hypothetical protein